MAIGCRRRRPSSRLIIATAKVILQLAHHRRREVVGPTSSSVRSLLIPLVVASGITDNVHLSLDIAYSSRNREHSWGT